MFRLWTEKQKCVSISHVIKKKISFFVATLESMVKYRPRVQRLCLVYVARFLGENRSLVGVWNRGFVLGQLGQGLVKIARFIR